MDFKLSDFTKHDWSHFHDAILTATWQTTKKKCTQEEMETLYKQLPVELQHLAIEWGMNDTVFREKLIDWYKENI